MTTMRVLLSSPTVTDNGNAMATGSANTTSATTVEQQIAANFAVLKANKKRKVDDEQLALETAALVQQEVQRWENAIRELEVQQALVLQQQQQHRDDNNAAVARHVPAVIADYSDEDDPLLKAATTSTLQDQQQAPVQEEEEAVSIGSSSCAD